MIFPYIEQSRADVLPMSLSYAKEYLHIDSADTSHDVTVGYMVKAARDFFEKHTNVTTTEVTYKTFRLNFNDRCFQIRKKPLLAISSVKYYDTDDVLQTVDASNYYIVEDNHYNFLGFKRAFSAPSLSEDNGWPIQITFTAGYSALTDKISDDMKDGILAHVAKMFENRGDSFEFDNSNLNRLVPRTTKLAIRSYKVQELGG